MILSLSTPNDTERSAFRVYTFAANKLVTLSEFGFAGFDLFKSDNNEFKGLIVKSGNVSHGYSWRYVKVVGGELNVTPIKERYYDSVNQKPVQISAPGRIADEWRRIEDIGLDGKGVRSWDDRRLVFYYVNDNNITEHI